MKTLYFSHSYAPEDRRFNEHIWKLFMKRGFHTWIDTGLEGGWSGNKLPMEIGFNEWMLSRCAGFVAVVPRRNSPYQALEYRLALRMGLPTLVLVQEGGGLGAIYTEAHEYPVLWQPFWDRETQKNLEDVVYQFAERVKVHSRARSELYSVGWWRPKSSGGSLRLAILQPTEKAVEWFEVQRQLQEDTDHLWELLQPSNFHHAHDLILATSQKIDLLVLDVGPNGTPRELVGYLDGLGIPQCRVCKVQDQLEADELGKYLSGKPRPPYRSQKAPATLPVFFDGLKIDEQMEPVFFWQSWPQLVKRLKNLTRRIEAFRSGLSPDEGGSRVDLVTHQAARQYFAQRYRQSDQGNVFLSFAGSGGVPDLADRLAVIIRFLDFRCFHYRDADVITDGRLESGELVMEGLQLRVHEADVVVLFVDEAYLKSSYCQAEMRQAAQLHAQGQLELLVYAVNDELKLPDEIKEINVFVHRGEWCDEALEQRIIDDIRKSVFAVQWPLREEERYMLGEWLTEDDRKESVTIRRLLTQSGVNENELDSLDCDWSKDDWFESFLRLPKAPEKRRRARELIALLILAVAEDNPDRMPYANSWLRRRRLLGWSPRLIHPDEDVVAIDPTVTLPGLSVTSGDEATVGQKLGQIVPGVLNGRQRLILDAEPGSMEVPIEWAREYEAAEPIAVRRPICWRLPFKQTRKCLFDDLSSGALPPAVLILALDAEDISPQKELRELKGQLDKIYYEYFWPQELIRPMVCNSVQKLESRLTDCKEQILHVAGHLSSDGLQVSSEILAAEDLTRALSKSDVRMIVLNGCKGGTPRSPLAFEYATLAERIIRDAGVPEIVGHRGLLREDDGLAFARKFYDCYFHHFDPARAAFEARKAGSKYLRLSPIAISQRGVDSK
jgi:hypothetical protein